jgi:glycerol-3-phosphate dehydrogenase
MLDRFLEERWPCSLDDVRRGTRLGMGPCQGAFCTFRAAGLVAEAVAGGDLPTPRPSIGGPATAATAQPDPREQAAELAEHAMVQFLRERYKGGRPVAWGHQLQELWVATGIYWGTLGVDAFEAAG